MAETARLKILVVDDSAVYRRILTDLLAELPNVEVVGSAGSGKSAISRIGVLKPDLLSLDIEMPDMDGLEVLAYLKDHWPDVGAVVFSGVTQRARDMAMKALELGAFDFVPKPEFESPDENRKAIREALAPVLKAFGHHLEIRNILRKKSDQQGTPRRTKSAMEPTAAMDRRPMTARLEQPPVNQTAPVDRRNAGGTGCIIERMKAIVGQAKSDVVGIGISTGGPNALSHMMAQLPPNLGVPILIVQHMPAAFTLSLAESLNKKCAIEVKEAADGEVVRPNVAYLAPGGKQMKVALNADGKGKIIRVTNDPPENSCKPSVDYLFRSIAEVFGKKATGVIMTGMGSDGVQGLRAMKAGGCMVIAQDEATSVVFGMPKEAIDAGVVDIVVPLSQIAAEICRTLDRR